LLRFATLVFAPRAPTVGIDYLQRAAGQHPGTGGTGRRAPAQGMLMTFRQLIAGVEQKGVIVARFPRDSELYRGASLSLRTA
jgi:segregation and condensation protein A